VFYETKKCLNAKFRVKYIDKSIKIIFKEDMFLNITLQKYRLCRKKRYISPIFYLEMLQNIKL